MTICRYYLQGNCRFGDRCRFEHTDHRPDNSNRRNDYNYQDRYRTQQYDSSYNYGNDSYNDSSHNYRRDTYGDSSFGKRDTYNAYNDKYHPNYGQYERQTDTYYSARYDDKEYRYSGQKEANFRNYNQNRYENSSEHSYNSRSSKSSSYYNTSTPKNKVTFSFKDPDFTPKQNESEDILRNEHNVFLAELMRKDADEWNEGKMWPFTSYSPKMNGSNFPGFHDFSQEELMHEAYKAMKTNSDYNSFVEALQKTVLAVKSKINELKNPVGPLYFMIDKYRKGEFPNMETVDSNNFIKYSSTTAEEMVAEEPQVPQTSPASAFSFKTTLDTDQLIQNSASAFSFKIPSETESAVKSAASAFSFKLPTEPMATSAFSSLPPVQGTAFLPEGAGDIYTQPDQISLQDKEQFLASTFTLGKIPTIPPAHYMCK